MRQKRKMMVGLVIVCLGLIIFVPAQAQNGTGVGLGAGKTSNMTDEEKAVKKDEVKAVAENRWETITCKKIETRLQARYQKYETNKNSHKQIYNKMASKIESIIVDFKAKGYDTSKVETDLTQLKTKLTELYADHDALIQKMKETQMGVCASTKENLGGRIQEIQKTRLETIKTDILDIKNFYSTVLRPDLVILIQSVTESASPTAIPTK